jgi:hypothetical protein
MPSNMRDPGIFGKYLRKPGNIFDGMQPQNIASGLLQSLQEAGTIRQDVDLQTITYVMGALANSLVSLPKTVQAPHSMSCSKPLLNKDDRRGSGRSKKHPLLAFGCCNSTGAFLC